MSIFKGVALAAVNLTSSVTALVQQTAAAAQSASTWGFNAGVQLDIDATKTTTSEKETTARGSNISGNKIVIQTGTLDENNNLDTANTQTTIRGSNLIATQSQSDSGDLLKSSINIETGDLNILSSKNTTETKTKTEHGHITAQVTVYGASGGASLSGSYDQNQATDKATTINNSQLNADTITLTITPAVVPVPVVICIDPAIAFDALFVSDAVAPVPAGAPTVQVGCV